MCIQKEKSTKRKEATAVVQNEKWRPAPASDNGLKRRKQKQACKKHRPLGLLTDCKRERDLVSLTKTEKTKELVQAGKRRAISEVKCLSTSQLTNRHLD